MTRVYKLLLPLYRADEMEAEIEEEWLFDSRGEEAMNFPLFTKLLHRIAAQWCIHIDLDEYIELLQKIYERIILKRVVTAKGGNY